MFRMCSNSLDQAFAHAEDEDGDAILSRFPELILQVLA